LLRVIAPERVVGHAEDVEARSTVEIDELPQRERSVAPGRVGVELAQESPPTHSRAHASSLAAPAARVGNREVKVREKRWFSSLDRVAGDTARPG
jgi:hypothetical protein